VIKKGKLLRLLRESLNLRQDEVAEDCGISASYLCLIEGGYKTPSGAVLTDLANRYNVPAILFEWNEDDLERTTNKEERELVDKINGFMDALLMLILKR